MKKMNRREFLKAAAATSAAGVLPAFATEGEFRGRVLAEGTRPMAGVAVTNGLDVVRTGKDGTFRLPRHGTERFVSVTAPSGWWTPRFYVPVADGVPTYDFTLSPWKASAADRKLCFAHIADSEIGSASPKAREMAARVKGVADRTDAAFIVHTGDICSSGGLRAHIQIMNDETMGRPVVYCIGNHDIVKDVGDYGEQLFESLYGPCWHSFDACGVHFCVTPMQYGDRPPTYTPDQVAAWLRNDLALLPKDQPVVLFNHAFWSGTIFKTTELQKGKLSIAGFDVTAACNLLGFVSGHLHNNQFRRFGKIAAIQTTQPDMGGVDLSPASVRVVGLDAKGRLTSKIHYMPQDVWHPVETPEPGGWIAKAPGPVYLGTPLTDGQRLFVGTIDDDGTDTSSVTAFDLKTGKVAWSTRTPNSINNQMVLSGGLVIAQDGDGAVHAYEAATGAEKWTIDPKNTDLRPYELGLGLDAAAGVAYAEIGKKLTAIEAATGRKIWEAKDFTLYGSTASTVAVGEGLVTGEMQWHGLYAADAKTGKLVWQRGRKGPDAPKDELRWRSGAVVFDGGKAYAHGGRWLYELDTKTGVTLRKRNHKVNFGTTSRPLLTKDRIFLGSCDGGLVALDRATLDIAWKGDVGEALVVNGSYCKPPQRQVATNPVLVDETTVCAAAGDGTIRFWDVATGAEKRRIETGVPHFSAPLVVGKRLYVADFSGRVRMVRL